MRTVHGLSVTRRLRQGLRRFVDAGLSPGDFRLSRWLFLRALGVVFLVAFASAAVQVVGLVGSEGLLSAAEFLERVHGDIGTDAYRRLPTLGWLWSGDTALRVMAWGGALLSVLLVAGLAPAPALLALWALYLSLTVMGQAFLSFQWDMLLLETAILAILYAPWEWRDEPARGPPPSTAARWLLWWLLFRLMVLSGATKLASGDPTWESLTALTHHYETQPLPTWIGWYAHHFPEGLHRISQLGMFGAELLVPVFIFVSPRRWIRRAACGALVVFQSGIALTGNYGFFNLLTVVLCLSLLDDPFLRRMLPAGVVRWIEGRAMAGEEPGEADTGPEGDASRNGAEAADGEGPEAGPVPEGTRLHRWILAGAVPVLFVLSCMAFVREVGLTGPGSRLAWTNQVLGWVAPLRSVNGYGLFRIMTTERPEVVLEVSGDGERWREVAWKWKPGDPERRPRFVAPHMPRLDWQMWFAALDPARSQRWLVALAEDVLRGTPDVVGLLGEVPTPGGERPAFVRTRLYRYRFSTPGERERTGAWWSRELVRELVRPASLEDLKR